MKAKMIFDMESSDPDDFLTLLLLLGHPSVDLVAVTIVPGTPDQVGLVRAALKWFGRDIPVGSFDISGKSNHVSGWHYRAYGDMPPSKDSEEGHKVLARCCGGDVAIVTGAALKNVGRAIAGSGSAFRAGKIVCQGGFAGEGVVPREKQLPKFLGMRTCPTFNLNGDPESAKAVMLHSGFGVRKFVSKNVCHGVYYDRDVHDIVGMFKDRSLSLKLIWQGMDHYFVKNREGKKFHDPLAACCAIDDSVGEWAEVRMFRERGEWGSELSPGSGTWIIVGYDKGRFLDVLTAC